MNRRGDLTATQIVGIMLVIVAAIILLALYPVLKEIFGGGDDNRELCKLSVLTRGAVQVVGGQELIPLRCTTEKICLSESGKKDECGQFSGERVTDSFKLDLDKPDEAVKRIERTEADAMYDCWNMLGEGKVDLYGGRGLVDFSEREPKCVVCARIALDRNLNTTEFSKNISKNVNVASFVSREKPSSRVGKTYAELMTGVGAVVPSAEGKEEFTDQVAVLFAQINAEKDWIEASFGTALTGVSLYASTLATPIGTVTRSPHVAIASFLGVGGASIFSGVQAYQDQQFALGYCGRFQSPGDRKQGCSVVRLVDWNPDNVKEINRFCSGGIEGNF